MSLGYPSLRPRPESGHSIQQQLPDPLNVHKLMLDGFASVKTDISKGHPLEFSEKNWVENKMKMDMAMLRNSQGLHAPLHIALERKSIPQSLRLPGLPSSNLMMDTLTGKLDEMEFDDIFNCPTDSEVMGQPHAMMERQLGLL